jgi:Amidohydrolase
VRFPDLKICLSEGGIGWVGGLLDRLEHVRKYDSMYGTWNDIALSPADTFRRNFWVCAIDDPSAFLQREVIGVENILVEADYPHADSTWPTTQQKLASQLAGLPPDDIARVTWANAAALFRHPVPEAVQRDPNAY